jgi:galactitol-specific phosphotransferase system IIB component
MAHSWPKAFWQIGRAFADETVEGGSKMKTFYKDSIESWGKIFSTAVSSAIEDINKSVNFEDMVLKFKGASAEIKGISQDIIISTSAVSSGKIEIANQGPVTVEIEANNLASKLTEAVKEALSELKKDPVAVNVSVDIDAIKSDLIETIKEGFKGIEYSFDMSIDRQKLATIIAESNVSGRTFQMRTI